MTFREIVSKAINKFDDKDHWVDDTSSSVGSYYKQGAVIDYKMYGVRPKALSAVTLKFNEESPIELYRSVCSKVGVMLSMGRFLALEQEYYNAQNWFGSAVTLIPGRTTEATIDIEEDPTKEFIPSPTLIDMVKESLVPPDKETFEMLEDLKTMQTNEVDEDAVLSDIITEEVEDLFTNLARRMFVSKKQIQISENRSFTHDISMDLIDRLGLHIRLSNLILERLHNELVEFLSPIDRLRSWGKITVEKSDIKLNLNRDAFSR